MGDIADMIIQGEEEEAIRKWRCKDGTVIDMEDMEEAHLRNAHRDILKRIRALHESREMLEEEALDRGIALWRKED